MGISVYCVNQFQRKHAFKTLLVPYTIRNSSLLSLKPILS